MAKLSPGGLSIKLSLDQVIETGNVRTEYNDIEDLAASIKRNGLIQAIVVKFMTQSPEGVNQYELICGHRRIRAFRLLCERGDDYTQIDAVLKTGDKHTLQLIENLQRSDLTPMEKEVAVLEMLDVGHTQADVAAALSKPATWVSDLVAAARVRAQAEALGVDTSAVSSKALGQLRSVDEDHLPQVLDKTMARGGTVQAATQSLRDYRAGDAGPVLAVQPAPKLVAAKDPAPVKVLQSAVFDLVKAYLARALDKQEQAKVEAAREILDLLQTGL